MRLGKHVVALSLVGAICLVAGPAVAAVVNYNMTVSAYVQKPGAVSAGSLNFGTVYAGGAGNRDATALIYVTAAPSLPYKIGLRSGLHYTGSWRHLQYSTDATNLVTYDTFKDSARTVVWGDAGMTTVTYGFGAHVASTGTGASQTFTVYGRLYTPPSTFAGAVGYYYDTVVVAVEY